MKIASIALVLAACQQPEPAPLEAPPDVRIETPTSEMARPGRLRVALTPYLSRDAMEREFSALVEYFGEAVGRETVVVRTQSYDDISRLFAHQEIDVAVLSPFAYVQAKHDNPELVLLATQIVDGSPTYGGYIVGRDDTGFDTLASLAGARFGFVDESSASGYLYPLAYLRSQGIDAATFFGSTALVGNHEHLLYKILERSLDAGAVASSAFKIVRTEATEGRRLKILAKTGRIPLDAYCASPLLDPEMVDSLQQALLSLSTRNERGRRVLRGLTAINGFVEVSDSHYDEVRAVARAVERSTLTP